VRVVLSMSTVGIAAGARDVLRAVVDELERQEIDDVDVSLSGSMGCDNDEVVMRVQTPAGEVTYGHLDPERARQIVQDHIRDGRKVERYIIARPIGTQADTLCRCLAGQSAAVIDRRQNRAPAWPRKTP